MLSNVAYIICGIFLLKLNEKARKVAIVLSVIGILSAPFIANLTLKTTSLDESRIFKSEKQKILKQTKIEFREEALKNLEQSEETAKKIGFVIAFAVILLTILLFEAIPIYFFTRSKVRQQFQPVKNIAEVQ